MFEIKYDREGTPIRETKRMEEFAKQAELEAPTPVTQSFPEPEPELLPEELIEHPDETASEQEEDTEQEEIAPALAAPEPESAAKKSFRELSAAKKKAERERDEYLRRIEELERRTAPRAEPAPVEEDEDFHLGEDDIAEGKHISKVDKRAQKKIKALEERLSRYETKTNEERAEATLRAKYPDFDKVVSMDNVAVLSEAYPELARSLQSTGDLYTKAVSAYTLIKKFGIYQESPFNSEKAVALKNVIKPRPLTSVSPQQGDTPLSRVNAFASGLTDELKAQLLKEMSASRRSY